MKGGGGEQTVIALPVTHASKLTALGIEIPAATTRRLGLDGEGSWLIVTEANRFVWPRPDLRYARPYDPTSFIYGASPRALFEQVHQKWLAL